MGITVLLLKLKTKLEFPKNVRLFSIWIKYWNLLLYNFLSSPTQQGLGEGRAEVCANQQIAVQRTSHLHTNP